MLDAEGFLVSSVNNLKINKELEGFSLVASVSGDESKKYKFSNDVKAITYNEMLITENPKGEGMLIQFVLDV